MVTQKYFTHDPKSPAVCEGACGGSAVSVARGVVLSRLWAIENTFLVCRTALAAAGGTTSPKCW